MTSRRQRALGVSVATAVALAIAAAGAGPAGAAHFTVKTLHFDVTTGPSGNREHCDIVGDLYKPRSASSKHRAPAILTTNGFGGSKDDQADVARLEASRGYVVLSYSGLGFGGSGCKITLDDRDYDGKAASQLVTFLGGGKAATDGTRVNYVRHDAVAHDGRHHSFDPRLWIEGRDGRRRSAQRRHDPVRAPRVGGVVHRQDPHPDALVAGPVGHAV